MTEKELLAVVYFTQYFRQYLLGRRFKIHTDHQALVWLFRLKEPNGKIARWIEILTDYDLEVVYRPGRKQGHCDALSRCISPRDCTCVEVDMFEPLKCGPCRKCRRRADIMNLCTQVHDNSEPKEELEARKDLSSVKAVTASDSQQPCTSQGTTVSSNVRQDINTWLEGYSAEVVHDTQLSDPDISLVMSAIKDETRPSVSEMLGRSPAARHYWIIWGSLFLQDGMLAKKFKKENDTGEYTQLIVPRSLR